MSNIVAMWEVESAEILPVEAKSPEAISEYALQLSKKDIQQITSAFEAQHYEMALNYLWGKTIFALKKELSTVGIVFLGEMLGKIDVTEDDSIDELITAKDAIRLAEELGVISSTDAVRLRHSYELITHFSQLDAFESDREIIDESEAISFLKNCVRGVLGRPKIEVAKKFVEFRSSLEGEPLTSDNNMVEMIISSPYFFKKLTISVLMGAIKKGKGAQLENVLANANLIIPLLWPEIKESERWQVGQTYFEVYGDGRSIAISGLKNILLKVKGFDYVPENLRSSTFMHAADAIIKAHEGLNNFHNEFAPVHSLAKLGSTIPTPALSKCISALLCVKLGNEYGMSWSAQPEADKILSKLTPERWSYYFNNNFISDTRVLNKILSSKPLDNFIFLAKEYSLKELKLKEVLVTRLIQAAAESKHNRVEGLVKQMLENYYRKKI